MGPVVRRLPKVRIIKVRNEEDLKTKAETIMTGAGAGVCAGPAKGNECMEVVEVDGGVAGAGVPVAMGGEVVLVTPPPVAAGKVGPGGVSVNAVGGAGGAEAGGPAVTAKVTVGSTEPVSASVVPPQESEMDRAAIERLFSGDVIVSRVAGGGAGPSAPPVVATTSGRSYASVAAAGGSGGMSPLLPGTDGNLHRRLLEALRKGESTITVEGREVDLSFWTDRHGLSIFREQRGGGTRWSPPTPGAGRVRRNVVRLRWRSDEACPPRSKVVELLLKMGFKAADIFALIHPYGTPEYDISFVRPEGLELFWSCYELVKYDPGWRGFAVQAITRQNDVKKVTILTRNESLSGIDIMTWLSRYGEVRGLPVKNLDEFGIWSGAWTFHVKLGLAGDTVSHIPSSAFIGRDRILIFYQGQPKLCHKCGSPSHFSASCQVQKCALCGGSGHLAATCEVIRCNLCGDLGHPFSRCPRSEANVTRTHVEESREAPSTEAGADGGDGAKEPRKRKEGPSRQRRRERRQKEGDLAEPRPGVMLGPSPTDDSRPAEAPGTREVNEEVKRLEREEQDSFSLSSHYESAAEASGESGEKPETRRKRVTKKKRGVRTSPPLARSPKEGVTVSPLVELSNRFLTLDEISASSSSGEEVEGEGPEESVGESLGGPVPASGEDARSSGGEAESVPGTKGDIEETGVSATMDTSVSLKRTRAALDSLGSSRRGRRK